MGKQLAIKGTQDPNYPELEEAAESYRDVRDARMELTEKEVVVKDDLLGLMKKHKLKSYRLPHSELVVELVAGEETVKVRKIKDGEGAPARTRFEDKDEPAKAKATATPEPPKSEPRRRSKAKGDVTKAHVEGSTTEITSPKDLIDLADEGVDKPKKKSGKGKAGKKKGRGTGGGR